jgi:hypothetical protein
VAGGDLACDKRTAADLGAWLCFEDESGQGLRPPKGRTWGRRGRTPVVKVTAQGSKRISVAALVAARPGAAAKPWLIYHTHLDRGSGKHRRKGFTETDYARLLDAAHQQLHRPIVLIWDNLPTHTSRAMAPREASGLPRSSSGGPSSCARSRSSARKTRKTSPCSAVPTTPSSATAGSPRCAT